MSAKCPTCKCTSNSKPRMGFCIFPTKPCSTPRSTDPAGAKPTGAVSPCVRLKRRAVPVHLQDVGRDAVLLAAVEGLGVEHDVGAVARLGADDAALAAQLHPGHRQDGPGHTQAEEEGSGLVVVVGGVVQTHNHNI